MTATYTLTEGELQTRLHRIADHLDSFGDLSVRDVGARKPRRMVEFRLSAPGDPCELEVEALFREYYDRTRSGSWSSAKYTYEYRDRRRGTRLAFHLHALEGSRTLTPHAHCGGETDEESVHLRATPYELVEANAVFMKLYAADADPDCASLLPLAMPRL